MCIESLLSYFVVGTTAEGMACGIMVMGVGFLCGFNKKLKVSFLRIEAVR